MKSSLYFLLLFIVYGFVLAVTFNVTSNSYIRFFVLVICAAISLWIVLKVFNKK